MTDDNEIARRGRIGEYWKARALAAESALSQAQAENELLRAALIICADELDRHGWGDFHYGSTGQDEAVVRAVAVARAALAEQGDQ